MGRALPWCWSDLSAARAQVVELTADYRACVPAAVRTQSQIVVDVAKSAQTATASNSFTSEKNKARVSASILCQN